MPEKEKYLFSFAGLISIIRAVSLRGISLFTILETRTKLNPDKVALIYEESRFTYKDIYEKTIGLANVLIQKYKLQPKQKAIIISSNSPQQVISIFALAAIGIDIYLLNTEIQENNFTKIIQQRKINFIIYDSSVSQYIEYAGYKDKSLLIDDIVPIKPSLISCSKATRTYIPKIVVLTSGTTGVSTQVVRKPSFFPYIRIFRSLLKKLQLNSYNSLYIAIPIYHGFGLIALLSALALGKCIYLSRKFDAVKTCNLIHKERIDVITLVPTMLQRLIAYEPSSLKSLRCIISGGAALPLKTIESVHKQLGDILYNLYGTSETSISLVATPQDMKYSCHTLGKPLSGVKVRIVDSGGQEATTNIIGQIQIKSDCSVHPGKWINTGDLGYIDQNGYYFLKGRNDDMIISGGENVFPSELEDILSQHSQIKEVIVVGIPDDEFGQRLKAFIVTAGNIELSEDDIRIWLSQRTARHQMPKIIIFLDEISLTPNGKPDKKKLIYIK